MQTNVSRLIKKTMPFILLFISALLIHFYFLIENSLFTARGGDSVDQYIYFQYLLHQLFSKGEFFWSWKYGLGGDIFGQFLYYYVTSLFFWFTMLFKVDSLRDVFELKFIISILKSYLAMSLMYILLRYNKRKIVSSLIGALTYGGSIFYAKYSLRADFMVDAMVWLPIMVLSYDRFVDKNKKGLFVFSIFLIVASNFYFAFITSVFLYLYAICKYFLSRDSYSIKDFVKYSLNLVGYYLLGLLLASFSFFPAVYSFLAADRFYREFTIPILFDINYYKSIIFNLFYEIDYLNRFALTLPIGTLFILFYGIRIKERNIRIRMIFTSFIFLLYLLPITYSFFNGLNAMQYRWLYLLTFSIALVLPFIIDWILENDLIKPYYTVAILIVLAIIVKLKAYLINVPLSKLDLVISMIGFISFLLLMLKNKLSDRFFSYVLLSLVFFNVIIVNYAFFNTHLGPYSKQKIVNDRVFSGSGFDDVKEKQIINYLKNQDKGFYRIMWNNLKQYNTPMLYEYNGFSTYQSLISYNIHRFIKEQYNTLQFDSPSLFKNLDNRLYLENILNNKYYVVHKKDTFVPYGFKKLRTMNDYIIYRNENFLPIGFMYNYSVTENEFNKLNFAQRDQLLLHALVVDNQIKNKLEKFDVNKLKTKVLHDGLESTNLQNVRVFGQSVKAGKNAQITIPITKQKEKGEILVQVKIKSKTGMGFDLDINGKVLNKRDVNNIYSYPQEQFVINLGYQEKPDRIKIKLSRGEYKIEEIKVIFDSYEGMEKLIKEKIESSLTNVSFTEGSVTGHIDVNKQGLLYLAVPYSKGWVVTVDGKDVDYAEVNHSFIGVPLDKGKHMIELNYITPYFKEGVVVSILSLLSLLIMNIFLLRNKNKIAAKQN